MKFIGIGVVVALFLSIFICYKKSPSSSFLEYINERLGTIFFTLGILFSLFGLAIMINCLVEFLQGLVENDTGVYNGFAILVFGVSLFSMSGSIQQTRKSNEEAAQLKNDINNNFEFISKKIESLNSSREDLHDEIEELKKQNQEIIKLVNEINDKDTCPVTKLIRKFKK